MKVIFLDIDGVLNWRGTPERFIDENDIPQKYVGLCPTRIARLNRILEAVPEAKVVLSSTWRTFGVEFVSKRLKENGFKGEIFGHTPIRFSHRYRGDEIRDWMCDWWHDENEAITHFAILDDDGSRMSAYSWREIIENSDGTHSTIEHIDEDDIHLTPNHVHTSFDGVDGEEGGLQDWCVDLAIKLLTDGPDK